VKAALRLVRHYNGGVTLAQLLGSARLMRLANEEMTAYYHQVGEAEADDAFEAHAGGFFASQGIL
jgi:hypothetical protein